ncbi:MAG: 4Fe-4S dicluster domain-containing protein [Bacteroidetes bacterium]|nr:4Fe-4S dicluster domain-containing protein [Bacteroidota bacterium]
MGINRRNYLKTLGVMGGSLSLGNSFGAPSAKKEENAEFSGILYDSTLCIGCQSCEIACAKEYGFPSPKDAPEMGVKRETNESRCVAINAFDTSKGKQHMRTSCNHCSTPACASACLTKAMLKTEEGPVIWREDKCIGCRSCMISCPFNVPKFEFNSPNPRILKCRMCYELLQDGQKPACVANCPAEAILFGKRRDLLEIAKARIYADPENYHHHIYGENEVGGTGLLYLSAVPFEELGFRTDLGYTSYPEYNKIFLYSVPAVLILWPAFLLGLRNASDEIKNNPK